MKHPAKEDLVSFLYEEISPGQKSVVGAHLQTCAACREQIAEWQKLKGDLSAWKLPATHQRALPFSRAAKWAAAAVFMLALGFGFGRLSTGSEDSAALRAEIAGQLQESFQQQLTAAREADRKEVIAMLRDIEEQRLADYTELRQDLETVAVIADEKLTSTERALSQLTFVAQSELNNVTTE